MKKVVSFTSPPMSKEQLDRLVDAVCPEDGGARGVEWSFNDDGNLDLYTE